MSFSIYQASIPVFIHHLRALSGIIHKAADYAESRKIDPAVLVNARLAPDMFPFSRQVQIATDAAKGVAARLTGQEVPSYEDTESTFAELQARIARTIDFIHNIDPAGFVGSEQRTVTVKLRGKETLFTGQDYLLSLALPNFYFHISTAYGILRHNGVPIGKQDYLGNA